MTQSSRFYFLISGFNLKSKGLKLCKKNTFLPSLKIYFLICWSRNLPNIDIFTKIFFFKVKMKKTFSQFS